MFKTMAYYRPSVCLTLKFDEKNLILPIDNLVAAYFITLLNHSAHDYSATMKICT